MRDASIVASVLNQRLAGPHALAQIDHNQRLTGPHTRAQMEKILHRILLRTAQQDITGAKLLFMHHRMMSHIGHDFTRLHRQVRCLHKLWYDSPHVYANPHFSALVYSLFLVTRFCMDVVRIVPGLSAYRPPTGSRPFEPSADATSRLLAIVRFYTRPRVLIPPERGPLVFTHEHRVMAQITHKIYYERLFYCLRGLLRAGAMGPQLPQTLASIEACYSQVWIKMESDSPETVSVGRRNTFKYVFTPSNRRVQRIATLVDAVDVSDIRWAMDRYGLYKQWVHNILNGSDVIV